MNRTDAAVYALTAVMVVGALVSINHMNTLYGPSVARMMMTWSVVMLGAGYATQRGVRRGYAFVHRAGWV